MYSYNFSQVNVVNEPSHDRAIIYMEVVDLLLLLVPQFKDISSVYYIVCGISLLYTITWERY